MEITWLGHSAVKIKGSKTVYIDPFLSGNPKAAVTPESVRDADVVVVTHYHGDHVGDAFQICKQTGAPLVAIYEVAVEAQEKGCKAEAMNVGGTVEVQGVRVHMVPAVGADPQEFKKRVGSLAEVIILEPGETYSL